MDTNMNIASNNTSTSSQFNSRPELVTGLFQNNKTSIMPITSSNGEMLGFMVPIFIPGSLGDLQSNPSKSDTTTTASDVSVSTTNMNDPISRNSLPSKSSSSVQPHLCSSDTLPLPTTDLAPTNSLPHSFLSDLIGSNPSILEEFQSISSTLQAAFTLSSWLSNKNVNLEKTSTYDLPNKNPVSDVSDNLSATVSSPPENAGRLQSKYIGSNTTAKKSNIQTIKGRKRRGRKVVTKKKTMITKVNEGDTDVEMMESLCPKAKIKSNSLSRDDTVILPSTSQSCTKSPLTASDTLILSSGDTQAAPAISTSLLNSFASFLSKENSRPEMNPLLSIPSLQLTDSMVNEIINPAAFSTLLSQSNIRNISNLDTSTSTLRKVLSESLLHAALQLLPPEKSISHSVQPAGNLNPVNSTSEFSSSIKGIDLNSLLSAALRLFSTEQSNQQSENYLNVSPPAKLSTVENKETQTDWVLGTLPLNINEENLILQEVSHSDDKIELQFVEDVPIVVELPHEEAPSLPEPFKEVTEEIVVKDVDEYLNFRCLDCDLGFSCEKELHKHDKSHKKQWKCKLCTSSFNRLGNYTRHKKIHSVQDLEFFVCSVCRKEFIQNCDLKRHMFIHTNEYPYRCEKCGKGYIRRSDLVVHMRFHNKDKAYRCNMCEKSYFQSGDLHRHMRRAHKLGTSLPCGHCGRKYACEVTLIRHMKMAHKDIILQQVADHKTDTNG